MPENKDHIYNAEEIESKGDADKDLPANEAMSDHPEEKE